MTDTTKCEFCGNTVYLFEGKRGTYFCNSDSNKDFHTNTCPKYKEKLFPNKTNNSTSTPNTTGSLTTCDFCGQPITLGDNKRRLNPDGTPHVKKETKDGKDSYSCIDSQGKEIPRKQKGKGDYSVDPIKRTEKSKEVLALLVTNAIQFAKDHKNQFPILADYDLTNPMTHMQVEDMDRIINFLIKLNEKSYK